MIGGWSGCGLDRDIDLIVPLLPAALGITNPQHSLAVVIGFVMIRAAVTWSRSLDTSMTPS
jgi:hypothetical protein